MEVPKSLALNNQENHRSLTPPRLVRGIMCLLVLVSTAFMMLVYLGFVIAVILRIFSVHFSRKLASICFGSWLALWPFLFEKINNTKVVFSGDNFPDKERILLIANHRTEVDWMYLWDLALRCGRLGHIKYVLKSSLMKLPVFGWAFHILEFIPVHRIWEVDAPILHQMLSTLKDPQDPLWLAIFPEGTDFTEQKCIQSQKYATEQGLPILKNVLLPKGKGFFTCVKELRSSLDGVCDVTIGYKPRCPNFLDNVFGVNPSEVHIHIQYVPLTEIPNSEEEVCTWLTDTFCLKDKLLSEFYSTGHFPNERREKELSTVKCLVIFVSVLTITSICVYLTFASFAWFKLYVLFVCVYMALATKINYRPSPPFYLSRWFKGQNTKEALE